MGRFAPAHTTMTDSDPISIKETLIRLVGAMNRADGPGMVAEMARLDQLASAGSGTLDPRLRHFLEQRSYSKALAYLGGDANVPAGTCEPPEG